MNLKFYDAFLCDVLLSGADLCGHRVVGRLAYLAGFFHQGTQKGFAFADVVCWRAIGIDFGTGEFGSLTSLWRRPILLLPTKMPLASRRPKT